MVILLATLAAMQALSVTLVADRQRVAIGEEVTVRVTVESRGAGPLWVGQPVLQGLELVETRDQSRVSMVGDVPHRTTIRTLRLVALHAGEATVGPIEVRQDNEVARSGSLRLTVLSSVAESSLPLDGRLLRLIQRALPPPDDSTEVTVRLAATADTVLVGSQLDVLTLAWFPQTIRTRLRAPPIIELPSVTGAWRYDRPTPAGPVLSREVAGTMYELFLRHDVLFPLSPGAVSIGPARVTYLLPVSYALLTREVRTEVRSESLAVAVQPLPPAAAGALPARAAGSDLRLRLEADHTTLRLGSAVVMRAILEGWGNVALWPEPLIAWPTGLRPYPTGSDVAVTTGQGRTGGRKTFAYLVVADSAGMHRVAARPYGYFDLAHGAHAVATAPPIDFVTPRADAARHFATTARVEPLPATTSRWWAWIVRWSWYHWLALATLPLVVWLAAVLGRAALRALGGRRQSRGSEADMGLASLERTFHRMIGRYVGEARALEGDALAAALRAGGVEPVLAAHAAKVRDRLRQAAYGPVPVDLEELELEVRAILGVLSKGTPSVGQGIAVLGLLAALVATVSAQSPEALMEAGAPRAAADSFAARAARDPGVAAHWYNLGVALMAVGDSAAARAAWLRAVRLAPRQPTVRRAWARVAPQEPGWDLWVSPLTPVELGVVALACWWLGWIGVARRRARYAGVALLVLAPTLGAAAVWTAYIYRRPVAFVQPPAVAVRQAPFGTAPIVGTAVPERPVRVVETRGAWLRIAGRGVEGWVRATELASL